MRFSKVFYHGTAELNTFEKHVNAPYVRGTFQAATGMREARLAIGATGFYRLFINGKEITKGLVAPYISNPDHYVYYDEYDITELTLDGNNTIGIILGNGNVNAPGAMEWDFDKAVYRNRPAFALAVELTDVNGEVKRTEANESFLCHPSPVTFDDIRAGCFYDANLEIDGWAENGLDVSDWRPVMKADNPRGEAALCEAEPIKVREAIKPVEISRKKLLAEHRRRLKQLVRTQIDLSHLRGTEGVCFDFGVNAAGSCRLKLINADPGQRIIIRFLELINERGELSDYDTGSFLPDGYCQTVIYIAAGRSEEIFEPSFTWFGYRYALVWGLKEEQIVEGTLVHLRASSDVKEIAEFVCSDSALNTIWEIAQRSDLSNFYYYPTDCPQREKMGWTGDAALSAEHFLLEYSMETSLAQWVKNICKAQKADGMLPGIVPTDTWGYEWGNGPAWDNALPEICYQIYRLRGDLTPAKHAAEHLLRYLAFLSNRRRADGLIAFGLGDWCQPDPGGEGADCPLEVSDTLVSLGIADRCAILFHALGLKLHESFARQLHSEIREAFRRHCIDHETYIVRSESMTAQSLALYYGAFDEHEIPFAAARMIEIVHKSGDVMNVGTLGARTMLHVLSDIGESELAYKLVKGPEYPSYGRIVEAGLTSMPEVFDREYTSGVNGTLNHHFLNDVTGWFLRAIAGLRINPELDNPNKIVVSPSFISELTFADAHYEAPAGRIGIVWSREEDAIHLKVTISGDLEVVVPDFADKMHVTMIHE